MTDKTQTLGFQAEVKQLLQLMIHSLYSNKEIFLRELISNASDALDKLRFVGLEQPQLLGQQTELQIEVEYDAEAGTITVRDNGIGMTRDEVIGNLGTIAKSGTGDFLQALTGDRKKDAQLIGQFGVGFYSSFIVADRVIVNTRSAQTGEGVTWESDGQGEFSIGPLEREARGTEVVLHLKDEEKEFANGYRLRTLVRKYSDHIAFPVLMRKEGEEQGEFAAVNSATALWTRSRSEITDQEYQEFYKHISHDVEDALSWSHNRVEGKREYTSLLYLPSHAPFDLWNRESPRGLKLYVQRVFIMDHAEQFLPLYLRFLRGILDSSDLPLNVSRELLQSNPMVDSIRGALTKRALDMLGKLAGDGGKTYQDFWNEFGQVLKEGPVEDPSNAQAVAGLLRFATTHGSDAAQDQSLTDYLSRMPEGQEFIYYIVADSHQVARNSPQLEGLKKRGIEVLLLSDRIDDWLVTHLGEYEGKEFKDVTRGELGLSALEDEAEKSAREQAEKEHQGVLERLATVLKDKVEAVHASSRLTESPACLVVGEHDMGAQMRRLMEMTGQSAPPSLPILEINLGHPLVQRLEAEAEEGRFADLSGLLLDQASLAEGRRLEDPAGFVKRLNRLLLELAG
ncbi:MAG: molecular chaperone HtpG [Gammaproteobacteria bacterium]|nr:molecular chaperone HtpG [Gammaproteobacteria bacterium]